MEIINNRSSPIIFFLAVTASMLYIWLIVFLVCKITFDWRLAEPDVCPGSEDVTKGMDRSLIRGAPGTDTDPRKVEFKVKDC